MAERFGRYELSRLAGQGGMAQVHLARQVGPQGFVKPCVLKRIAPGFRGDEEVRRMFLEEARISALLNHPHIVQTFDYGEVDGAPFMAMELVDGVNLAQLCRTLAAKERWIPLRSSLEICTAVAEALAYAHALTDLDGRSLNLVHRDVSPQNVLLSRQGGVKLADFGIARHDARDAVTIGNQAKGKPGYMAPEQAMGVEVDARADLFALGIVLTELVSARRVIRSGQAGSGLRGVTKRVEELVELRADAPPELREVVLRLTAIEPSDRPASARETADLLRKVAARVPEKNSLSVFLEKVFERYFPDSAASASPEVPSQSGLGAVDPNALLTARDLARDLAPLEGDPTQVAPGGKPDAEGWAKQERAQEGSAAIYEGGWPKEYLANEPKLELVARSSSVDAMQYFGAQGSSSPGATPHTSASPATSPHATSPGSSGPHPLDPTLKKVVQPQSLGATSPDLTARRPPQGPGDSLGGPKKLTLPPPNAGTPHGAGMGPAGLGPSASLDPNAPERVIPKILGLDGEAVVAVAEPSPLRRALPFVGGVLGVAVLAFGVIALFSPRGEVERPAKPTSGSIVVSSTPPGAAVLVDGQRTPNTTPAVLNGLPLGRPIKIAVLLEGHRATPGEVEVVIPETTAKTQASFTLRRGRSFHLETTPGSALVSVNGARLAGLTPLDLPVLPFGETATISIALEGYLSTDVKLHALAETATVVEVKLEPSRLVDVLSEPPGAEVYVDKQHVGRTPLYDLQVPDQRAFRVRIEKRGYKPWAQQLLGKRLPSRAITADLQGLPLLAMPMSKEEREEARDLDHKLERLSGALRQAKAKLALVEKRLAQIESQPNVMIARVTDAQSAVDDTKQLIEDLESQRTELETQVESFRTKVMSKLEGTQP